MNQSMNTRPDTEAEKAYASLTDDEAATLLRQVFEILEYDKDGEPGNEWDSDTTGALGEAFGMAGITFTDPSL